MTYLSLWRRSATIAFSLLLHGSIVAAHSSCRGQTHRLRKRFIAFPWRNSPQLPAHRPRRTARHPWPQCPSLSRSLYRNRWSPRLRRLPSQLRSYKPNRPPPDGLTPNKQDAKSSRNLKEIWKAERNRPPQNRRRPRGRKARQGEATARRGEGRVPSAV